MSFPKYQTKELLNKVLNAGEDALKVDIDNVTLDGSQLSVDIDKENDSIVIYSNTAKDGSGTNYVPLVDSDGHLQVDSVSTALPSGAATAANQSTIIGHVDGIETLLGTIDSDTDAIKTAVELLDNAVDGNYLNVNANIAGTDFVGGAGAVAAGVQRVTLASDDPAVTDLAAMEVLLTGIDADTNAIKTAVEIIDNAISGSEMQVDIVSSPTNSATVSNQSRSLTSYAILTGSNLTTDNQGLFSYEIRITGTDNCTLKVQGSNDNSNWVDDDMDEVTIATGASGLISGTSFFKYIRLQFKSSATNGTTVNAAGFAK